MLSEYKDANSLLLMDLWFLKDRWMDQKADEILALAHSNNAEAIYVSLREVYGP